MIEELAPGSSKLDLPLERHLSCFIIFKNLSDMSDSSQDANDFSVHLIPFFFFFLIPFYFHPLLPLRSHQHIPLRHLQKGWH